MSDNLYERDVYKRAIEILQERGWTQGRFMDDHGRVCATSAIGLALEEIGSSRLACYMKVLQPLQTVTDQFVMSWNDEPGRTLEEVILLLKYAEADELETWHELFGPGAE